MIAHDDGDQVPPGRRERLRQATLRDLRAAALDEVREHGGVALSLRSVARRMGMSPAGLYRYVDSREDLLTLLIADGYRDLGSYLEVALGAPADDADGPGPVEPGRPARQRPPLVAGPTADVADRLRAAALAYRHWAVTHPNEFGLLFGDPIPGYAAPPDGPTVAGMRQVGLAFARPVVEAWHQGRLRVPDALTAPELAGPLAPMAEVADELPPSLYALLLLTWGRLHGQVSLEVFGHHDWLFPDGCEALYRAEVEAMLTELGVLDTASSS